MNQAVMTQAARRAYQATQLQQEDGVSLVVQLYDGMLGYLRRGADMMADRNALGAAESVRRAVDIVGELQAVLDLERGGEIAANLDRLYTYCRRRIMESHLAADPSGLQEVAKLMAPMRDAWAEARVKQAAALQAAR